MSKALTHGRIGSVPHGPNDSNEGHEQRNTIGKVCPSVKFAPDHTSRSESRQILVLPVGASRYEDDYYTQGNDVER